MPLFPNGPKIEFLYPPTLDLSVVIPVHRHRKGLKRCLESIVPQLRKGTELVVVDHSEGFETRELVRETPNACPASSFRYIPVTPTGSMSGDWNLAVSKAQGRWIHLMHDDDFVLPGLYDWVLFNTKPPLPASTGVLAAKYSVLDSGKVGFVKQAWQLPVWPDLAVTNQFQPSGVIVACSTYELFGGYVNLPELRHCPDWELYARVAEAGIPFGLSEDVLVTHTEGSGEQESSAPWCEIISSYGANLERMIKLGVQKDAIAAGFGNLINAAMKRSLNYAALNETYHEKEVAEAFNLAVKLERLRRSCERKEGA